MTSNTVAGLLATLGIDQSHSRPHVSNDNPYSEAQFKTLKYCPAFPGRFGSIEDSRVFCTQFFRYYNNEHRHSGIAMHTPASVHDGTAVKIHAKRIATLNAAFLARPERFRGRRPTRRRCQPKRGSTSHQQLSRPLPHHKPPKLPDVSSGLTGSGPLRQRAEKEPNMNDLLDFVLDAHGGLKRWSGVSTLTAKLAIGGPFWTQQGFPARSWTRL
jgi:hypothetical protein